MKKSPFTVEIKNNETGEIEKYDCDSFYGFALKWKDYLSVNFDMCVSSISKVESAVYENLFNTASKSLKDAFIRQFGTEDYLVARAMMQTLISIHGHFDEVSNGDGKCEYN